MSIAAVKMINSTLPMIATPVTLARLARIADADLCAADVRHAEQCPQAGDQQVRSLVERRFADVVERTVHRDKGLHPAHRVTIRPMTRTTALPFSFDGSVLDLLADEWQLVQRRIDDVGAQLRVGPAARNRAPS